MNYGTPQRDIPQDIEAEACVIGCMILDPDATIMRARYMITAQDFIRPAHSILFSAILDMVDKNIPVELVALREYLERNHELDKVGGIDYIVAIADGTPGTSNLPYYAHIVAEKSKYRQMISLGQEVIETAYAAAEPTKDVIDTVQTKLFDLSSGGHGGLVSIGDCSQKTLDTIIRNHEYPESSSLIQTGFPIFDKATGGINAGDYMVLAGVTSAGKTSCSLRLVENVCSAGYSAVFISGETRDEGLATRLMQSIGGVSGLRLRRNELLPVEIERLKQAQQQISRWRFDIEYGPKTASQIRAICRNCKQRWGKLDVLFVDYLQKMKKEKGLSPYEGIGKLSEAMKDIAIELNTRVVAIAQLGREVGKECRRPVKYDLKGAGEIENDADIILLLWAPETAPQNERLKIQYLYKPLIEPKLCDPQTMIKDPDYGAMPNAPMINKAMFATPVWGKLDKTRDGSITAWTDEVSNPDRTLQFRFFTQCTRFENA